MRGLIELIIFFICAIIFSFVINGLFLKFSKTLGIRNNNGNEIRWSSQDKPSLGGISFYIIFLVSIIFCSFFHKEYQSFNLKFLGFFVACTLGFVMGLADDAFNTRPLLKFFTQLFCSLILIFTGTYINIFQNDLYNYLITIFWVVGLMNSINMLDNMDSIATIVSVFILVSILVLVLLQHFIIDVYVLLLIGILASLIGFLFYNWYPSKMYMGDTGSQLLGIFLAGIGIVFYWNNKDFNGNEIFTKRILNAVIIFSLPIIDTTIVVFNRIMRKQSPFIGGKDHTTHNLFYLGHTEKQIAFIFSFLSAISVIMMVIINSIAKWNHLYISLFVLYLVFLFGILFYVTKMKKKNHIKKS
ncbi:MAG: MraY family glycosyltransferase [Bacteroidales bacterium]|jgi:UDP-GlcNAc:undecaprenyl-phosphate GlcNAc-1-phosphate transferase